MRIGDPFTLVVPQCHDAWWKRCQGFSMMICTVWSSSLFMVLSSASTTSASVSIKMGSGIPTSADTELGFPYGASSQASGYLLSSEKLLSNWRYFSGTSWLMNSHAVVLLFGKGDLGTLYSTILPSSKYSDISPGGKYSSYFSVAVMSLRQLQILISGGRLCPLVRLAKWYPKYGNWPTISK